MLARRYARSKKKREEEMENDKKCVLQYLNGNDILDDSNELYANVLGLGMRELLQTRHVYKDTLFKELLESWSTECSIPMQHLLVWNYTERKNKTVRPNRQIKFDLNQKKELKSYTEDVIKRHLIPTQPKQKKVQSIYDRIGNIMERKRMFVLLDDRNIASLGDNSIGAKKKVLVALKYFDFLTQKLHFADWLFVPRDGITFGDIARYIEDTLIANTKDNRVWMQQLNRCNQSMRISECKHKRFLFYEEVAVLRDEPVHVCEVDQYQYRDKVMDDFYDGDIFVFQMNPCHTYFGNNERPVSMFWYRLYNTFIEGQLNLVNIEVKMCENTGWKQQWSKALLLQYKNNINSAAAPNNIEQETQITKSMHKWRVEKRTTFGMIRRKLAWYYGINPHHIELWLPQCTSSGYKWDYGSKGRGKWDDTLESILTGRRDWKQLCPLKFEIQAYNVNDFEQMIKYADCGNRKGTRFDKRIKDLAMFNFEFGKYNMTISYCKDWYAQDIIQYMLSHVVQNPVFGYTFFAHVIEYIKKYEMDDSFINDLCILQSLKPHRFLIIDDNDLRMPTQKFYMKARYAMPKSYSHIKYTDFKVLFLAKNDPLVVEYESPKAEAPKASPKGRNRHKKRGNSRKKRGNHRKKRNRPKMRSQSTAELSAPSSKALWVLFRKKHTNKRVALTRCVWIKGETLKHLILTQCLQYLKIPKPSLSVDTCANNKQDEDAWLFDCFMGTHEVVLKSRQAKSIPLKKEHIENKKLFDELDSKIMCLHVFMPKNGCIDGYIEGLSLSKKKYEEECKKDNDETQTVQINLQKGTKKRKEKTSKLHCKLCNWCGVKKSEQIKLKLCSRCKDVYYCSKHCQKRQWNKTHRLVCW
eukprot:219215_1